MKIYSKNNEYQQLGAPSTLQRWHFNKKLHRKNEPAYISFRGSMYWIIEGKYHREDGPALNLFEGSKYWYLNGVCIKEERNSDEN